MKIHLSGFVVVGKVFNISGTEKDSLKDSAVGDGKNVLLHKSYCSSIFQGSGSFSMSYPWNIVSLY